MGSSGPKLDWVFLAAIAFMIGCRCMSTMDNRPRLSTRRKAARASVPRFRPARRASQPIPASAASPKVVNVKSLAG